MTAFYKSNTYRNIQSNISLKKGGYKGYRVISTKEDFSLRRDFRGIYLFKYMKEVHGKGYCYRGAVTATSPWTFIHQGLKGYLKILRTLFIGKYKI